MGWTRWIQKETLRKENWKCRRRIGVGGFTRVEKIMILEWGRSEMVVNSYLEDLGGRMRLKRMWKLIP